MFFNIINLIKYNYNLRNLKLKLNKKLNKNDFKIIEIFIKLNIIKFIIKKNKYTIIYFKYVDNNPVFFSIKNLFKPSKLFFINLKQIKKMNKKMNNIFVLSTNKGLMTNFEAEKNKIGGVMVFLFNI